MSIHVLLLLLLLGQQATSRGRVQRNAGMLVVSWPLLLMPNGRTLVFSGTILGICTRFVRVDNLPLVRIRSRYGKKPHRYRTVAPQDRTPPPTSLCLCEARALDLLHKQHDDNTRGLVASCDCVFCATAVAPCFRFTRPPSLCLLMPTRRSRRPRRNSGWMNSSQDSDSFAAAAAAAP